MRKRIRGNAVFDEGIVPRRFRTTVLTDLYDETMDIRQTQAAAGHATPVMTQKHYVKGRRERIDTATPVAGRYGRIG